MPQSFKGESMDKLFTLYVITYPCPTFDSD